MKDIKFILCVLWISFYTSIIWATVMWKGLPLGPNNFPVLLIFALMATGVNVVLVVNYLREHWND